MSVMYVAFVLVQIFWKQPLRAHSISMRAHVLPRVVGASTVLWFRGIVEEGADSASHAVSFDIFPLLREAFGALCGAIFTHERGQKKLQQSSLMASVPKPTGKVLTGK
jgi:hypothetical protein